MKFNELLSIQHKIEIVIWGAGEYGREVVGILMQCAQHVSVNAIIDSNRNNIKGKEYLGNIVLAPDSISNTVFDYIVMAVAAEEYRNQIQLELKKREIETERIIIYEGISNSDLINIASKNDDFLRVFYDQLIHEEKNAISKKDAECELQIIRNHIINMDYFITARRWYISHDGNCAYLDIPKAAGTSIKKSICEIEDDNDIYERTLKYAILGDLPKNLKCYRFSFVRNPFARILSCYIDKIKGREKSELFDYNYLRIDGISYDKGFDTFVNAILDIPDKWSDVHFKSQYNYLVQDGKRIVDYVGKVETIEHEYELISKRFGLYPIKHLNKSAKYDIKEYYTKDLVEKVFTRYQKDFIEFGYITEYERLLTYYSTQ